MRDPDTGLHMEYLALHARVPIARLEQAWEWAKLSDHPECRHAVWAIARNHAIAPRTMPYHGAPSTMWNNLLLSTIWELYSEFEAQGRCAVQARDLSSFHCRLTQAGEACGHPGVRVLAHRILEARAAHAQGSFTDRRVALQAIWNPTYQLEAILAESPKLTYYPVPRLRALFTAEEVVYREALCWARRQPEWSEAFRLFEKLRSRIDRLVADCRGGKPVGNKTQQKQYAQRTKCCKEIARLYLDARARRVV